jgi:hypothetical protein
VLAVRLSEFWERMDLRFGHLYAQSVAADFHLTTLGATVNEALAKGTSAKTIWRAICEDFEVPSTLR